MAEQPPLKLLFLDVLSTCEGVAVKKKHVRVCIRMMAKGKEKKEQEVELS